MRQSRFRVDAAPSGEDFDESPEAQFRRALADVRRAARRREGAREGGGSANANPNPLAERDISGRRRSRRTTGGASDWHAAMASSKSRMNRRRLSNRRAAPSESAEAILEELGLIEHLTEAELARLRRLYMWRNHPDRHRESQRASATRRVAIANMLLDRARSRLAGGRRP